MYRYQPKIPSASVFVELPSVMLSREGADSSEGMMSGIEGCTEGLYVWRVTRIPDPGGPTLASARVDTDMSLETEDRGLMFVAAPRRVVGFEVDPR